MPGARCTSSCRHKGREDRPIRAAQIGEDAEERFDARQQTRHQETGYHTQKAEPRGVAQERHRQRLFVESADAQRGEKRHEAGVNAHVNQLAAVATRPKHKMAAATLDIRTT